MARGLFPRHNSGVKRWRVAFLLVLLSALPILFAWNRSPELLRDSDTKGILAAIRAAHDPLKWFRGDWPIANGFYRPISALTFEMDNALWGGNAAGYGLTNALLCFACVLLLFWTLREVTDRPLPSALGAALFALWHVGPVGGLADLLTLGAWATLAVGVLRHRRDWRAYAPAFLTLLALSAALFPIRPLAGRMIDWIPGRTASTMTFFALIALAAYARFERSRRPPVAPPEPSPETPPATRNTEGERPKGAAWPWAVVAILATALALGSYEQAVMLPALLLMVGFVMRGSDRFEAQAQGHPAAMGSRFLHLTFWTLLLVYAGLRWELLPHVATGYQRQQFSSFATAFRMETEYLFPPLFGLLALPSLLAEGPLLLLTWAPYAPLVETAITGVGYLQARKERTLALVGYVGSALAFAPMAAFKLFEHYHYLPMAFRAAFVVAMGLVAARLAATAWSPPGLPTPPRLRPAPGSLPRP